MNLTDPIDHPEAQRVAELTLAIDEGRASEAEREELTLYADAHPQARTLATRVNNEGKLGGKWLARTQADERLRSAENTPFAKHERRVGAALITGGLVTSFFFPPAVAAVAAGALLLGISVVRIKLKTLGQDPYSKIDK